MGGKKKKPTAEQQRRAFINNLTGIKAALKSSHGEYIWGVDISLSNTGLTAHNMIQNTYESFSHKKFKGTRYQRLLQLEKAFEKNVSHYGPKFAILEGYAYGAKQSREIIGEASYCVKRCFTYRRDTMHNVPCLIVPPMSLKKFVTGRAHKVDKEEILKVVRDDWGAEVDNHDEADSYALCVIGLNIYHMAMSFKSKKEYTDKDIVKMIKNNFGMSGVSKEQFEIIYRVIVDDGNDVGRFFA